MLKTQETGIGSRVAYFRPKHCNERCQGRAVLFFFFDFLFLFLKRVPPPAEGGHSQMKRVPPPRRGGAFAKSRGTRGYPPKGDLSSVGVPLAIKDKFEEVPLV